MIYHITGRAAWRAAQDCGIYSSPTYESEGFIHCSRHDQILNVANEFYAGANDLLLLCIDEKRLTAELRWEAPAHPKPTAAGEISTGALFPHLYGPLNLDAVARTADLVRASGVFCLPCRP